VPGALGPFDMVSLAVFANTPRRRSWRPSPSS